MHASTDTPSAKWKGGQQLKPVYLWLAAFEFAWVYYSPKQNPFHELSQEPGAFAHVVVDGAVNRVLELRV